MSAPKRLPSSCSLGIASASGWARCFNDSSHARPSGVRSCRTVARSFRAWATCTLLFWTIVSRVPSVVSSFASTSEFSFKAVRYSSAMDKVREMSAFCLSSIPTR